MCSHVCMFIQYRSSKVLFQTSGAFTIHHQIGEQDEVENVSGVHMSISLEALRKHSF